MPVDSLATHVKKDFARIVLKECTIYIVQGPPAILDAVDVVMPEGGIVAPAADMYAFEVLYANPQAMKLTATRVDARGLFSPDVVQ